MRSKITQQFESTYIPQAAISDVIKRLFDCVAAGAGLVLLSPLFAVITLLIAADSPGPVIYRSTRVGKDGREFQMFKFRTMVIDADKRGGPSAPTTDPRITRIGGQLRRSKLDELPQLINVLKGEMSIVGPRPEVPEYVAMFSEEERVILSVRPGMTDWASIWNYDEGAALAGSLDPERTYLEVIRPTKVQLQLAYVRERSLLVDLKIIGQTLGTLVRTRR